MRLSWRALCLLLPALGGLLWAGPATPPLPPVKRSPAEQFRELLAASPAQRRQILASRSAVASNLITAKLKEFEVLPPLQREVRLQLAQLQYYLSPLLHADALSRANQLAGVPAGDRPLIEERLRAWDALPAETQREISDSERSLSYFVRQESADPQQLAATLRQLPAPARPEVEAQFARWSALPPGERARKTANFQRFFGLNERERDQTLSRLPDLERRQMQLALSRFSSLPPAQRDRCVRAFHQLAALSPDERTEFLGNVAQWQTMTAGERSAWRALVQRAIQPPSPPPLPPPLPPTLRRPAAAVVMTNQPVNPPAN